jgi:hypothetical protein
MEKSTSCLFIYFLVFFVTICRVFIDKVFFMLDSRRLGL